MNRKLRVMGGIDVTLNRARVELTVDEFLTVLLPGEARWIAGLLTACADAAETMHSACGPPATDQSPPS